MVNKLDDYSFIFGICNEYPAQDRYLKQRYLMRLIVLNN
ncbi:hypothetical protein [Staphylococcus argenteus]|nr:hypothetical protein [Staphylococcus argenteus]API79653.1 hypothetical protein A7971_08140 [Staphylococcus argenteus]ATY57237.1 hypothetical protein CJ017_08220 [Staphylococcus argenteus]MCG6476099.1 hypothetical protein [Staphylococcus argenteus]MCG9794985.1 hypothetical protein [Staphylococcus argenteus]MCG9796338.1 hypothetical protein [Staphylococcus argenteus]